MGEAEGRAVLAAAGVEMAVFGSLLVARYARRLFLAVIDDAGYFCIEDEAAILREKARKAEYQRRREVRDREAAARKRRRAAAGA